jgi:tetratricopeptide (TPR) repeat protein
MRAFLEGERDAALGRWDEAALAYNSAIAADSAFSLAYFGYVLAHWWGTDQPVTPDAFEALKQHLPSLPERERLLVEAFLTDPSTPRLRAEQLREVVRRFPDFWPGWFLYADALFHGGPAAGYEWTEGLEAFQRAVKLKPNLVPAWEHLFHLAIGRDTAEAGRAYARLTELGCHRQKTPV